MICSTTQQSKIFWMPKHTLPTIDIQQHLEIFSSRLFFITTSKSQYHCRLVSPPPSHPSHSFSLTTFLKHTIRLLGWIWFDFNYHLKHTLWTANSFCQDRISHLVTLLWSPLFFFRLIFFPCYFLTKLENTLTH